MAFLIDNQYHWLLCTDQDFMFRWLIMLRVSPMLRPNAWQWLQIFICITSGNLKVVSDSRTKNILIFITEKTNSRLLEYWYGDIFFVQLMSIRCKIISSCKIRLVLCDVTGDFNPTITPTWLALQFKRLLVIFPKWVGIYLLRKNLKRHWRLFFCFLKFLNTSWVPATWILKKHKIDTLQVNG